MGGKRGSRGRDICIIMAHSGCCTAVGLPGASVVKHLSANAGDASSISGLGRSPGVGNGNPLHYSCLENHMHRGVWWATVHGVTRVGYD